MYTVPLPSLAGSQTLMPVSTAVPAPMTWLISGAASSRKEPVETGAIVSALPSQIFMNASAASVLRSPFVSR